MGRKVVRWTSGFQGEHHDILKDFFDSNWTDDEAERLEAREAYHHSIGGWNDAVAPQVKHAYYEFRDEVIKRSADEFLREHGIDPDWT